MTDPEKEIINGLMDWLDEFLTACDAETFLEVNDRELWEKIKKALEIEEWVDENLRNN